ncbi:efflux RND transporter periplasmic adaptor subunit [Janthinobacterium fluminis]|uniref:HlyD family efflux transporter periplasmic adaptor subunit n=1 Tax=Janthinobacterium fluminis TaxID=2987524 RepID=A0ABT5K1K9_9BURK|nr:HlyD family efflux transporter periplasmic adaptor subunit [Janthinobacterium fluminis]MDC8758278.1 HlyD family efflux transporter periplasmic adaptor subunit [Janthinobacterium fluminis]
MKALNPQSAVTGAAMDVIVPRRRGKTVAAAGAAAALAALAVFGLWQLLPRGLQVPAADVRIATVENGIFLDDIVVRSKAEALHSVILDSVEAGRVEEVFVHDGAVVRQGDVLFRISNPQRNLELLQRQSEHTQQISNLSNLRVGFEAAYTDHQRRLSDLAFGVAQAQKQHARNVQLAARGFISPVALEESADALEQKRHVLGEEKLRHTTEAGVKLDAVRKMESAIRNIETGLTLVRATVEALVVRAPVAGRLTDFKLQIGETVKTDQHIGRIDDPARFKLSAQVDEYYLNRIAVGRRGRVKQDGQDYPIEVSRVYPQIKDGRFSVELVFTRAQAATLNPGQSIDAQITLGEPKPALLLPNAPFVTDSGGAWVFVVAANGIDAEKRPLKTGRRNNGQIEVLSGLRAGEQVLVSSYAGFGNAVRLQLKK